MTSDPPPDPQRLLRSLELRLDRVDGTADRHLPVGNLLTVAMSALGGDTSGDDNRAFGVPLGARAAQRSS